MPIIEILLVPAFMLADYFLTILGAVLREKKYAQHVRTQHYELNPVWQEQVSKKRWISVRHLVLTLIVSMGLLLLLGFGLLPEYVVQATLGCLLTVYGLIVGRHISNLLLFDYVIRRPDTISGEVTMSHRLVMLTSIYQYLAAIGPIILIAVFSGGWFVYGAVVGVTLLCLVHLRWLRKTRKQEQPAGHADSDSVQRG